MNEQGSLKVAVVGGGAAGMFLAANLGAMAPGVRTVVLERAERLLRKVRVSGGGRCNCTNTFEDVGDLAAVYPRGHRLMKRLFNEFDQEDAWRWFEQRGVRLTAQEDGCVFPVAQDSRVIIECLVREARRCGAEVWCGVGEVLPMPAPNGGGWKIAGESFDCVVVAVGGQPRAAGLQWYVDLGGKVEAPVPSLFTFTIDDASLRSLMGTVVEGARVFIPGTKLKAEGALLITHWGVSGPAVLHLSSYAARHLAECAYRAPLGVNWLGKNEQEASEMLRQMAVASPRRRLTAVHSPTIPSRLWEHLLGRSGIARPDERMWCELSLRECNRLATLLTADVYEICGRSTFKEEFVTCGGVALSDIHPATLESRVCPGLYFVGEVLDVDGVTGGYNLQAAWTTAYTVAKAIARL